MRRRGWRYLRRLGASLPACYPEAAIHYLAAYPDATPWQKTWIANHIFHHTSGKYGISNFTDIKSSQLLKYRAFAETWQRSPEPLLRLLGMARAEKIRHYACDALKQDFKIVLRDIEPQWIIRLAALPVASKAIDDLIVWLLQNAPKLEQHQFRSLGLYEVVIGLLESPAKTAQHYAVDYVKAHARDVPLDDLLRLAANQSAEVRELVQQLLGERDPRQDIGLEAWGQLLEIDPQYTFAAAVLRRHFGRQELTSAWFQQRLISASAAGFRFSEAYLLELHPRKTLGLGYFQQLLERLDSEQPLAHKVAEFALAQMSHLELQQLTPEFIQTALLSPLTSVQLQDWLVNDKLKASQLPLDFYQALAYEPDWAQHPFIKTLRQTDQSWAKALAFDHTLAATVRSLLADVRRFSPADLGFEWLMTLVNREEPQYHDFAVELMIKAFVPADFAAQKTAATAATAVTDKTVDLQQQRFLFTGQLKTMTRKQAQTKVSAANGINANSVTNKLHYLVIGDEGSPLYGHGRKGSKQLKAETLINKGAELKIISETAFLQMLAGEQREFSADDVMAGCQTLWQMATEKPDTPVNKFALKYLRTHHPDISLKLTDRPVDPGAEIPDVFVTFERFKPLFEHAHTALRELALDFAHYEFARWSPDSAELIRLCESKHVEVREFVSKALLAETDVENKRYRIDAAQLAADAVYSFCESSKLHTRQLGMQIIQRHEHFQLPEALFQLTESPDRELRGFVVRILWSLYRRYSTTPHWKPSLPVMATMSKTDQAKRAEAEKGDGLPKRPDQLPADPASLQQLLRRWLYELPPGRLGHERLNTGLTPLSASAAKKALIETFRDVALDDVDFAQLVLPLFKNFSQSRGLMEQAACLVATTRIQHAHPSLAGAQ